ncbi:hypothetical protein FIU92_02060 [Ruegeria sp. THAF33]|nr:hypothetical protein FIU92_02060 [Ruegeria sp. THAF33]
MWKVQGKEMGLLFNATDHNHSFAEIDLSVARCMIKRHEHLAMPSTVLPNIILDDGVTTLEAMLITQSLADPLGRMPLFARSLPIFRQPLINDPGEPIQLGPPDRC